MAGAAASAAAAASLLHCWQGMRHPPRCSAGAQPPSLVSTAAGRCHCRCSSCAAVSGERLRRVAGQTACMHEPTSHSLVAATPPSLWTGMLVRSAFKEAGLSTSACVAAKNSYVHGKHDHHT
eukprot:361982-Chlamydomonas_euryale.AAC.3